MIGNFLCDKQPSLYLNDREEVLVCTFLLL